LDGTVADVDSVGVSQSWTYAPVSGVDAEATCAFADAPAVDTTITCTDDGTYEVTLTASDGVNAPVSDSAMVTVQNVSTDVGVVTAPVDPVQIGSEIDASVTFSDVGVIDAHTATFAWGDSTSSPGVVIETSGSGSATGSHVYSTPGIYTIIVTVTDDDGGSTVVTYQFVVVYDPDGGFVTGGGWITSPAGAYPADPSLTGKASFGFVAKYKKGQSVPDGNTQFQFQAAGMSFHSTSYDWLVIAGAKAKFKGTGTIDGSGSYGFMLSGVDGQASGGGGTDRFRIKIWDIASGEIVYDNQIGDGDDEELSTALGGGSIVIHKK
jgi:PKD repeat protein